MWFLAEQPCRSSRNLNQKEEGMFVSQEKNKGEGVFEDRHSTQADHKDWKQALRLLLHPQCPLPSPADPPSNFSVGRTQPWQKTLETAFYIILENRRYASQGQMLKWGRVLSSW